ncbi:MAG: SUMF1/EgtB/PvdO family nonheme iron enzyme, partial [Gammaproteobacteria bacterium]|nr:SUMF1/EgtB/PvdO family nonheme iron enzyme [Gammaproteobacteria bacterium]
LDQIEQQRKKLEQVTADYQKARKEAQDNIDYLRDELHAERDARDVERVEMATRQRELKEQLTTAASKQEGNTSDQSGVIEEAVDAARAEEQGRLQGVIEAHAATEEQLAKVQAELQQAHAELAEHHREEKTRRQGDVELMEEQNRQAEAAIAKQQDQLQILTEERDSALETQQELREKMDALRAEVEVARGLMNGPGQGQLEDPVQLRKQLDDTRQNVEIAVRLRTEAETARDRLLEERDKLLVQLEDSQQPGEQATDSESSTGGSLQTQTVSTTSGPGQAVTHETAQPEPAAKKVPAATGRRPRLLGPALSLLAVSVTVAVVWLLMTGNLQIEDVVSIDFAQNGADVDVEDMPPVAAEPSEIETAQESSAEHAQPAPIVREKSARAVKQPAPARKKKVAPAAEAKATTPTSPVVRTFNDRLKIGGRGPTMTELAAASYQMGSPGNSVNYKEVPQHEVKLSAFSISRYEVTFDEYARYARATGKRLPKDEGWGRGKQPVINVSWSDARGYAKWLSKQTGKTYRLPTEAEWEYAARGGSKENYWWIGVHKKIPANCFNCGSDWDGARTAPVGQFAANDYGLHDMAGNVQEWTADCYNNNYTGAPVDGSAWLTPECTARVVRGGAYSSPKDSLRSAKRGQLDQDTRLDNVGFRVVRVN